jgi:hypothetical protein
MLGLDLAYEPARQLWNCHMRRVGNGPWQAAQWLHVRTEYGLPKNTRF